MGFINRIKQSAAQVVVCNQRLKAERDNARRRVDAAGAELVQISATLDRCRRELHEFRRATFESYVAQNPPPPSYDVVTTDMKPVATTSNITNSNSPLSTPTPLDDEKPSSSPLTRSPPPSFQVASEASSSSSSSPPLTWGSRNPYAAGMAERAQAMSID
jgi:hypothetical protein